MPPQPLQFIPKAGAAYLVPECMEREPAMAVKIALCMARCSNCESNLSSLLARLVGSDDSVATDIFLAINSSSTQFAVLHAAATKPLDKSTLDLFEQIMKLIRTASKKRNRLAHHVLGGV